MIEIIYYFFNKKILEKSILSVTFLSNVESFKIGHSKNLLQTPVYLTEQLKNENNVCSRDALVFESRFSQWEGNHKVFDQTCLLFFTDQQRKLSLKNNNL